MTRTSVRRQTETERGKAQSSVPVARLADSPEIPTVIPASKPITTASPPDIPQWSNVQLGPDLPMAVFTSTERWNPERIGGIAIYCSDGRWGESFDEFCHKHLQLPRYDRLALPGGPACFAAKDDKSKAHSDAVLEQLAFLVRAHELKRIVLITHYACALYAEQLQRKPDDCLPVQMEDLRTVTEKLRSRFEGVKVEAYVAMRRASALSFHAQAC